MVRYQSGNLITPLVHDILSTGHTGTSSVLTKTNEEALQITGLLVKHGGMQAKLIQTYDDFSLYNLSEVRFFLIHLNLADDVFVISDDICENAKRELRKKFQNSTKLFGCNYFITTFILIIAIFTKSNHVLGLNYFYKSDLD